VTSIFSNREFQHPADGWYQIEPAGEHLNREGGVVQVIDGPARDSIVNRFMAKATAPRFSGMLIDHEHFKLQTDKETVAYGWLMQLQNRADGIYGQVKWTASGQAAVDGGDYRFFSTEYDLEDGVVVNRSQPKRVRPMALSGLTLTNCPNNRGGKPITNRAGTQRPFEGEPEAAGRAFSLIVNRIRRERNCTFEQAWYATREQAPVLFAAMGGAGSSTAPQPALNRGGSGKPAASITAGEVEAVNDRFLGLVCNRREKFKLSFEQAWDYVGREFPDLFARARGRVLNRTAYFISPDDQKKADKLAPNVLSDLRVEAQGVADRGQTTKPIYLRCAFISALKLLQADGMSLEESFAYLRENEPVFWMRGVLSYTTQADEEVRFRDFEADKIGFSQDSADGR
jgi:hypothetical protein